MYILKQLRRKKEVSQTALANEIGVSLRTIQLYEKKNANIPIKNLTKIADFFEMSIAELYLHEVNEMGEGYLRKQPFVKNGSVFYPLDHGKQLLMAPLVLVEQYPEYIEKITTTALKKITPFQMGFVIDFSDDGPFVAFEVAGDAMNDESIDAIPNKTIVLGLGLEKEVLKENYNLWDKPYILVCKNRIICKQLIGFSKNEDTVQCHNLNTSPEYQDFEIPLDEIIEVFKIVKKQL